MVTAVSVVEPKFLSVITGVILVAHELPEGATIAEMPASRAMVGVQGAYVPARVRAPVFPGSNHAFNFWPVVLLFCVQS